VTGIPRASTTDLEAAPGTRIDDVTIAYRIAVGMSSDVFAVWHHGLLTPLICKRLRPGDAGHAGHRRRLRLEGHALSLMSHPGIVRAIDQRHATALPYLLLEHVGGRTLRAMLKIDGPFATAPAVRIVQHVAAAVAHVHARGFLHRDLKPSNVVLRDGRPVLLDFGVVWRLAGARRPPDRSGTPQYLAPEQIHREPLTPATDVYGLGVLLYELLGGERPFPAGDVSAGAPLEARYPQLTAPPRRLAREIPAELALLVAAFLEKNPAARPQSAVDVVRLLDPFSDVKVWPSGLPPTFAPFGRRTTSKRHLAA
jgi:serine/threonine protein kinase